LRQGDSRPRPGRRSRHLTGYIENSKVFSTVFRGQKCEICDKHRGGY